jgi:selenocysteine lyase/cysteine desulfurase
MGFQIPAGEWPLWQRYRPEFPVCERYVYLNHAAVAPLSRRSADAMKRMADDCLCHGANHYDQWLQVYEKLRTVAAELIRADSGEIAIVKNTSEGVATVAFGFPWRPGDRAVIFHEEFPANYHPWKSLEARGVKLQELSISDSLDRVAEACRGARLLAVSFVNYLTGYRVNLTKIGEICRAYDVFFFVDAIQGLGAYPINVRESGIHALAADGHKWLLGPEGCGILYVQRDWQDRITPAEIGWTNYAHYADYASRDTTLRPDAGRYEPGTLNTIGCFGLLAAIELLLEAGESRIQAAVEALAVRLASQLPRMGFQLSTPRTVENGSGIVSFRSDITDARFLVSKLRQKGIIAASRQGWVRLSPHFYVSPEDIERTLDALA